MAVTVKQTASWGVSGSVETVTGVVIEIKNGNNAVLAQEQNELGAVIGEILYDKKKTMQATIQVKSSTKLPAEGAPITIAGVAGYVVSSEAIETNTSFRRILVTAQAYEHCTATTDAPGGAA